VAGPRAAPRWVALLAAAAGGFALTGLLLVRLLDGVGERYRPVALEGGIRTERQLGKAVRVAGGRRRIFLLGDSLVFDMTPRPRSIPDNLAALLAARTRGRDYVRAVASPGLGAFAHYFLADRILAARPDVVVLSVNLHWFSPIWRGIDPPTLAGWLPARRWAEALALPLEATGVSADRLAFYRALVASGALPAWYRLQREQLRVQGAWQAAARRLQALSGMPEGLAYETEHGRRALARRAERGRSTATYAAATFGPVFAGIDADSPTVRALDTLLARYRDAGVAVVVYVAPINVEHLRRLGVYDARGAASAVDFLGRLARRRGARFLDLHALLPDAAFADQNDHLRTDGPVDGAALAARRLLPLVLEAAEGG
jgi:hypothetical protein